MEQKDRAQQEPGLQDTTAQSETLSEEEAERTCRFKDRVRQAIEIGTVKRVSPARPRNPDLTN